MTVPGKQTAFGLGFTLLDALAWAQARGAGCRIGFGAAPAGDVLAGLETHLTALEIKAALASGAARYALSFGNQMAAPDIAALAPALDQLAVHSGLGFMAVCCAHPGWGRTVYQGHMFQDGRLKADLLALLRTEISGRVAVAGHEVVALGAAALSARLAALKEQGVMLALVDALNEAEMAAISTAFAALPLTGGPGWLAAPQAKQGPAPRTGRIAILAAGADRQTLFQLGAARGAMPYLQLAMPEAAIAWGAAQRGNFIISAAGLPETPAASAALAATAAGLASAGVQRFVLAGAAPAILARLGVGHLTTGEAVQGLRWLHGENHDFFIKPDGFGAKNLFLDGFEPQIRLNAAAE